MIGHLGHRVTALLDGQLSPPEEERAWEHVHACHSCRDAVEREGWVKTQVSLLGSTGCGSPSSLRESLLDPGFASRTAFAAPDPASYAAARAPRHPVAPRHLIALGGSALGMAVLGVLALSGPANAPQLDRRGPVTSITPPVASSDPRPAPTVPTATATVRRDAVRETMAP